MKPKTPKLETVRCKGCALTIDGTATIDEVVHDPGCVFYDANAAKTFEERVVEAVVADLKANGKIRHAMLGLTFNEDQ